MLSAFIYIRVAILFCLLVFCLLRVLTLFNCEGLTQSGTNANVALMLFYIYTFL